MTLRRGTIAPDWFVDLYGADGDPWSFETSPYEREKYRATLAALGRERYACGFEIGCANGVLTEQLARRVDRLLAVDVVPQAIEAARDRCRDLDNVTIELMQVPETLPAPPFDLILLSEVGYYWEAAVLERFARWAAEALTPEGELVLVHWRGETDYPLTGDETHDGVIGWTAPDLRPVPNDRSSEYRLDVLRRTAGRYG